MYVVFLEEVRMKFAIVVYWLHMFWSLVHDQPYFKQYILPGAMVIFFSFGVMWEDIKDRVISL